MSFQPAFGRRPNVPGPFDLERRRYLQVLGLSHQTGGPHQRDGAAILAMEHRADQCPVQHGGTMRSPELRIGGAAPGVQGLRAVRKQTMNWVCDMSS